MIAKKFQSFLSCFFACLFCSQCHAERIEVQGHRGSRGTLPENSIPAFEAAIAAGADVLELDLLLSKDGIVFIHHNFSTHPGLCSYKDGTALNQPELISSLTAEEIKKIDCGCKVNPQFPSQKPVAGIEIPTLQELLDWIKFSPLPQAKAVRLNLEIKRDPRHPEFTPPPGEIAKKVLEIIEKNDFSKRVYFSSFDPEILKELRILDAKAVLGFIYTTLALEHMEKLHPGKALDQLLILLTSLNVQIISPQHSLLRSAEDVRRLKQAGLKVVPWTVNERKRWKELMAMGVDGLITDYPEQLIDYLKKPKVSLSNPKKSK